MSYKTKTIKIKVSDLAKKVSGSIIGNENILISGVSALDDSKPETITFYKGSSVTLLNELLDNNKASAILISEKLEIENIPSNKTIIQVKDPFSSFITLVPEFYEKVIPEYNIDKSSYIHPSCNIASNVQIGPFCYIGENVEIKENVIIHPHVCIYSDVKIENNVTIHSGAHIRENTLIQSGVIIQNGAIIGADGFGYVPDPEIGLRSVPQVGNVELYSNVEIGANTCIDRGAIGPTRIGLGTKVDNLVQVGHNTQIGNFSIVCGQSAIAGSAKIGNQVVLGGNVGVADHTEVTDGCRFGAFSGLHGTYDEKGDYAGNPAMPARTYRRVMACIPKLPELFRKLK